MRLCLCILSLLPLLSFGQQLIIGETGQCYFGAEEGNTGGPGYVRKVYCVIQSDTTNNIPENGVLTKDKCLKLQADILDYLRDASANVGSAKIQVDTCLGDVYALSNDVQTLRVYIYTHTDEIPDDIESSIIDMLDTRLSYHIAPAVDNLNDASSKIAQADDSIADAISAVRSYSCSDGVCESTGGGSASCPCQREFNDLMDVVNQWYPSAMSAYQNIQLTLAEVQLMSSNVSNIALNVDEMIARLNAPDDRMYNEIIGMYSNVLINVDRTHLQALNLYTIFNDLRQMLGGDDMKLSSEGLLMWHSLVFDMANFVEQQTRAIDFGDAVRYFSNTVTKLFNQFDQTLNQGRNNTYIPPDGKYGFLYNAFTNDAVSPRDRWVQIQLGRYGGVTNWFHRMELYQQAQLGWFDEYAQSPMEQEQERLTESSLELQILNTTNNLGAIVSASGGVSNSLEAVMAPVQGAFEGVVIQASLPTIIRLLPEIDLGEIGNFGPIDLDTTEISDYCDYARKISSLIWRIAIWSLYAFLAFAVGRVLFVIVLYVINFLQNL